MSRPYQDAPASVLSGGNGWDTSAVLRAAADAARDGRIDPIRFACDTSADNGEEVDADLSDFGYRLAFACIYRVVSEWPLIGADRSAQQALACDRAADWLDSALAAAVRP